MKNTRKKVPTKVKDAVLKEYRHRCSMCGGDIPQLHHIDENPNNNDPINLLPLCPNCHLKDQHDPTSCIEIDKLQLFRKYKDPTILKSQFHPLYKRLKSLHEEVENISDYEKLRKKAEELIEFVLALKMGEFYSKQLSKLITQPPSGYVKSLGGGYHAHQYAAQLAEDNQKYLKQLQDNKDSVHALVIELLRYQDW